MENLAGHHPRPNTLGSSKQLNHTSGHSMQRNINARIGNRIPPRRDPPGQQCVYIPPGDHRLESYRLSTFTCFGNEQISIFDLAESGFYYTGYKDRTKCFSCGIDIEDWKSGEEPSDPKFHEVKCPMTLGGEFPNVPMEQTHFRKSLRQFIGQLKNYSMSTRQQRSPAFRIPNDETHMRSTSLITSSEKSNESLPVLKMARVLDQQHKDILNGLDLCKEADRRASFAKWPTYPAPYLPRTLAKEGFFYLGNLDRVQCFSCSGVLRNWAPNDDVKQHHRNHFPACRLHNGTDPRNEEMGARERAQFDSEDDHKLSILLPNGNVSEPPDPSPAERRFLENKLPCSDPTNARMSSFQARLESFRRWPTHKTKATAEQLAKAGMFYMGESDKTKCFYCGGGLQNWDYNDEPWTEHAKWFPGCEFVNQRKGTKFVKRIADAHPNLKRPSIRNGIAFQDIPDFAESFHDEPPYSNDERLMQSPAESAQNIGTYDHEESRPKQLQFSNQNDTSLLDSFREAQEAILCKICKSNKSDVVFLPCGHVVSCSSCSSKVKKCVTCSSTVMESIRVFRA